MKEDRMHILAYLRGELPRNEKMALEARMAQDSALKIYVEKMRGVIDLIKEWEPPPLRDDFTAKVMANIAKATPEYNKHSEASGGGMEFLKSLKKLFSSRSFMIPGLAVASIIAVCIIILPWQREHVPIDVKTTDPQMTYKDGPVMVDGPRLPKATILMDTEGLDLDMIQETLKEIGAEVIRTFKYNKAFVLEIKIQEGINLKRVLEDSGQMIRYNRGYRNQEGLAVIVFRAME